MKKSACLLLIAILLIPLLAGCSGREAQSPFAAENEILTYERIDPKKTQITISRVGNNANAEALSKAFMAINPDVQVITLDYTGGDIHYRPVEEYVIHGAVPDLMFVNYNSFKDDKQIVEYMEDLSASPYIERFEAEALIQNAIGGHAYFLPAPSEINTIMYNKTLFEQYGWALPTSFDDFVALCVQIRKDTDGAVQPWNPNAKYESVFLPALEAFAYDELFGGLSNRTWYDDFLEGKATFAGHMEPFYAMIQTLIDNGILLEEHFTYSATTRGKDFDDGKLAMLNAPIARFQDGAFEIGYMPYPSSDGTPGYVIDTATALLCMPKKVRTDAQKKAIERFLAFYSSVEGQQALIGDTLMVSNVKGAQLNQYEALAGIRDAIDAGRVFRSLEFSGSLGSRSWTVRENAMAMLTEGKTGAEIIATIDAGAFQKPDKPLATDDAKLAEVTEDFTILAFSCYIADAYREKAGADVGLINHNIAYRGNLIRLFKGPLYDFCLSPIKPRSFANKSTLVKVSMTGRQLTEALNHPVGNNGVSNSVYAFSGLKCELAPANEPGGKVLSVTLADGSALDMDKLYTVACWDGTVAEAYITEVLETYEGTWEDLMRAKLTADGTIAPAKDGRYKLVWR